MMKLQVRGPSSRSVVSTLTPESTLAALLQAVAAAVDVHPDEQRLMVGFPPSELDLSDWDRTLQECGIKSGDSIMVERSSAKRGIVKASAEESQGIVYSIPKNQGLFVQRAMPPDNSCLFHTIAYVCMNRQRDAAATLRKMVAETVASDPRTYNEMLLEQSNRGYQQWIMNPNVWGGAIELAMFSEMFQTEIVAFDPDYLREDNYGQNMGYKKRVFILFTTTSGQSAQSGSSAHYDALVFNSSSAAAESKDKVIFSTGDSYAWDRARQFIEHMHKERVKKNPSLPLCKTWRRTQSGEEARRAQGRSMIDNSACPAGAAASSAWDCGTCTFKNHPSQTDCEMCGVPRS